MNQYNFNRVKEEGLRPAKSTGNLAEQAQLGQFIGEKAGVLANLMSGSNGRDKMCALLQYSVQLYTVCMRHSHDELWTGENSAVEVGERIVFNVSQGRKIFKFLKFLEPLRKFHEQAQLKRGKPRLMRVLQGLKLASQLCLYLCDNVLWFANMGIINSKSKRGVEWRRLKDVVALWKNGIGLVKLFFDALRNLKRQLDLYTLLGERLDDRVEKGGERSTLDMVRELIILRSKMRFVKLGALQNVLRVLMLAHRVSVPFVAGWIHPIGVCVCGVLSNLIAIAKLFRDKKQVIQLQKLGGRQVQARQPVDGDSKVITYGADGRFEMVDARETDILVRNQSGSQGRFAKAREGILVNRQMEYRRGSSFRHGSNGGSYDSLIGDRQPGLSKVRLLQGERHEYIDSDADEEGKEEDIRIGDENDILMSVEEGQLPPETDRSVQDDDEDDGLPVLALDDEGEVVYDVNAAREDHELLSLRKGGSFINYQQLISFEQPLERQQTMDSPRLRDMQPRLFRKPRVDSRDDCE